MNVLGYLTPPPTADENLLGEVAGGTSKEVPRVRATGGQESVARGGGLLQLWCFYLTPLPLGR